MNLLIASPDFLPFLGGVSILTHNLANALAMAGASVTLLAPRGCSVEDQWRPAYDLVIDEGASVEDRIGPAWTQREKERVQNLIRDLHAKKRFGRLLATHPHYYGQAMLGLSRELSTPFSVMFHGFELRSQLLFKRRVQSFRQKRHNSGPTMRDELLSLARQADEVLVNSAYTRQLVRQAGRKTDIRIIGAGLPYQDFREISDRCQLDAPDMKSARKAAIGLSPNRPVIGTISRLVQHKNVSILLKTLSKLPDFQAVIIGDGPLREELHAQAEELGLSDRILWTGLISEEEKWKHLEALDVFCLGSRKSATGAVEGFGIVMLEAAAAGVPVIASNSGGVGDAIVHRKTGLLTRPGSATAFAKSVLLYQKDPALARACVKNLRNDIIERFNWEKIASDLFQLWSKSPPLKHAPPPA